MERLAQVRSDLGPEAGPKRLRLVTRTDAGDDYDVLARNAVGIHVDAGILVRVAALDDLIRNRRAHSTPEHQQAAAVLLAVQELSHQYRFP